MHDGRAKPFKSKLIPKQTKEINIRSRTVADCQWRTSKVEGECLTRTASVDQISFTNLMLPSSSSSHSHPEGPSVKSDDRTVFQFELSDCLFDGRETKRDQELAELSNRTLPSFWATIHTKFGRLKATDRKVGQLSWTRTTSASKFENWNDAFIVCIRPDQWAWFSCQTVCTVCGCEAAHSEDSLDPKEALLLAKCWTALLYTLYAICRKPKDFRSNPAVPNFEFASCLRPVVWCTFRRT